MPSAFRRSFEIKALTELRTRVSNQAFGSNSRFVCALVGRRAHGNLRADDSAVLRSRPAGRHSAPGCKQPAVADNALDDRSVRRHEYFDLSALVLQRYHPAFYVLYRHVLDSFNVGVGHGLAALRRRG